MNSSFLLVDVGFLRKYVLSKLLNLKFLDCYEVTKQEKETILKDSLIHEVVTFKDEPSSDDKPSRKQSSLDKMYTPLPSSSKTGKIEEAQSKH